MQKDLDKLRQELALLHQIVNDMAAEILALKAENKLLKAKIYGKSSEKLTKNTSKAEIAAPEPQTDEEQLRAEEAESAVEADDNAAATPKNRAKRLPLPPHLPREDVILNPDPKCPSCGGEAFRKIADDISEMLEYKPSSFKVIRHVRPRCACINCEQIVQAFAPENPIAKGNAGPGLLAHIMTQKYCNHLPLYRQSQMYEREELYISRSTMAGWAGQVSRLLSPLVDELKNSIFASSHIHADDTTIRVLAPGSGKTKTGRLWVYVRDGRAQDSKIPPAVCYFYSPDRQGIRPLEHLKDFTGTLHADAYAGYDKLFEKDENGVAKIDEAACWAHTRRKFHEVTVAIPNAGIAAEMLEKIGRLYEIEDQVRGKPPEVRLAHRQKHSSKIVDEIFIWLKKCLAILPKKSETTKAINYALNLEVALRRYLSDGKIEIDNNIAERAMRIIALGRKNYMFAGSDAGGETAANFYSLVESAKLNGVNPQKYLTKILTIIQNHNSQKLAELLPWNLTLD